ncbi:hypothetical protein AYO41_00735 [Verrucomicrobia bacterium SCGC AG-212-E04]|nr:hypothetical protein AYO41_00735 [Verrucomicrobia bacterium SCGC AG-212-E04]
MPNHDCETYDFPVTQGAINYSVTKQIVQALGGTWQIAVQDAIDEAKAQAQDAGETAMKNEKCTKPCDRFIYVDITLGKIAPRWTPGKVGKEIKISISGTWQAGILCVKSTPKSK